MRRRKSYLKCIQDSVFVSSLRVSVMGRSACDEAGGLVLTVTPGLGSPVGL